MNVEIIEVTGNNVLELINDESVYAIRRGIFGDGYRLEPIECVPVGLLLSDEIRLIRITK